MTEDLPQNKDELLARIRDLDRPTKLLEISEILGSTIKRDEQNKLITFLSMLLTYTEEDQINVSFTAEASTGKSYIPQELAWYFPSQDVLEYAYVSPSAFFHEYGNLVPDPADKRDIDEQKKAKLRELDLHQKIIIFMDQPHDMLLQRLRPLLSHDRKQLISKIANRSEKAGLRTETVKILGYPTVLFCTAKVSMEDQERTRQLVLSPETSQEKIRDSILLKILKESDREEFHRLMEADPKRVWLASRVQNIASSHIRHIKIPEPLRKQIADRFFQHHSNLIPRHTRDVTRLLAMIKACALLNLWQRNRKDDMIEANQEDVQDGFSVYEQISAANELGLPPEIYEIFCQLTKKWPEEGGSRKEFSQLYYKVFHRTLGKKRLEEIISVLQSTGLMTEEPDPQDHRQKRLLLEAVEEVHQKVHEINTPWGGGEQGITGKKPLEQMNLPGSISDLLSRVSSLSRLPAGEFQDKCFVCSSQGTMDWQINEHDGSWAFLCQKCGDSLAEKLNKSTGR